ncbi:MAG TPA: hypothetical protein VIU61_23650, partial [Kofleriaceae bacterium]
MRAVAILIVCCLSSCSFAVKHPAITAGIVGGTVTLASCELASADQKACFMYSGAAALGLGLVVAAALWLGTYEEEEVAAPPGDDTKQGPQPDPEPDRDLDPEPGTVPPATPPAPPTTSPPPIAPPAETPTPAPAPPPPPPT